MTDPNIEECCNCLYWMKGQVRNTNGSYPPSSYVAAVHAAMGAKDALRAVLRVAGCIDDMDELSEFLDRIRAAVGE